MHRQTDEKSLCEYVCDYTLFDLETTGISRESDEIIEISAVKVRGGEVVDEFTSLVNPGISIPYEATLVNHITNSMVRNAPSIRQLLPPFFRFAGNDILVGHNIANFDIPFIRRDCLRYFNKTPPHFYIDTLRFARMAVPGLKTYRLTSLAERYGIETEGAHRALNDCRMNQKVFERLADEFNNR